MIEATTISALLGIEEAYQAPERLMGILNDKIQSAALFRRFLERENDLSDDWFVDYFQEEHGDRNRMKQDYTPSCIRELLSNTAPKTGDVADICAGTGSLAIALWHQNPDRAFYLEEKSDRCMPFLLFNLMIRRMDAIVFHGDVLTREGKQVYRISPSGEFGTLERLDQKPEVGTFPVVVMNPPFSLSWNPVLDERFFSYGLAPKRAADFAFLLHGYHLLELSGQLFAIIPHGVLFRGGSEKTIRSALLEEHAITGIIGLPNRLFLNTDIPVCILSLEKGRTASEVCIINAEKEFEKGRKQNTMREEQIEKIGIAFRQRLSIERFSKVVSLSEIQDNDYNLNIPRYAPTWEVVKPPPLVDTMKAYRESAQEINRLEQELYEQMRQLIVQTTDAQEEMKEAVSIFEDVLRKSKREEGS